MKFRYYITNTFEGQVEGTNDEEVAKQFAQCDEFYVIDSEKGVWLDCLEETSIEKLTSVL